MPDDPTWKSAADLRRHPRLDTDLPVAFSLGEVLASESAYLSNLSAGGVAFDAMVELAPGTLIELQMPPGKPVLRITGRVVWCRKSGFQYSVGVEFVGGDPALRQRIVDMVRHIERYRHEVAQAGRPLSSQAVALEWIERFGQAFFTAPSRAP